MKHDNCRMKHDNCRMKHDNCRTMHDNCRTKRDNCRTMHDNCRTKRDNCPTTSDTCRTTSDTSDTSCASAPFCRKANKTAVSGWKWPLTTRFYRASEAAFFAISDCVSELCEENAIQCSNLQRRRRDIFVESQPKKIFQLRQERHIPRMANTCTQIYIHVVFAVEGRQYLIAHEHNDELQKYITGIVSAQKQKLIAINNMPDHLHLLIGLRPDSSLSDLVRDIKANSSKFINEQHWVAGRFSWQEGFGAFSYSRSQLGTVIRYIENQQEPHAKQSFRDEYVELLEKCGVDYHSQYIFKTCED